MEHVLNNPFWNALISGSSNLSNGNDVVKYFAKDISPFVGLKENSIQNLQLLHDVVSHDPIVFMTTQKMRFPIEWKVLQCIEGFQMIYSKPELFEEVKMEIVPLEKKDVPQMLALTKLTNPGPFAEKTIKFGHYLGIFDQEKLVAMAGQRLHVFEYAEISAVCTHPDYLGKGYAKQLLKHQINRIKAASEVPFLHVRSDNKRAIQVYQSLGFQTRTQVFFYVLMKAK